MNLAIDIGNTHMKAGWFDHHQLIELQSKTDIAELSARMHQHPPDRIIVSSVSAHAQQLNKIVPASSRLVVLDGTTPLPFQNSYHTPTTLGTDRIAAVAGAQAQFPDRNLLIIDAGTCVTYDLLTDKGCYLGGNISPGLRMRWQAMHTFTARLPLVSVASPEASKKLAFIGKTTEEGLKSGGLVGMAAEIDQIIRRYADKFAALQVVACGGDIKYLQPWLFSDHIYIPELVLIGLNSIVQYEG
ncbi:type III pantothenate kinase [Tunicatimonas pelagia]|uniref:type III pantothenate kinase n=1 Tax=Tunicatimonas pelagia TaxID=931531 RepID=UPI002664FF21|nr:type III pantothenate kinase [Tunicatimonas pelagia]WKN42150.1 type III pantothenate kinase [Tunicatimonas pelagia]